MPISSHSTRAFYSSVLWCCALTLCACAEPLSGTWTGESGRGSVEFRANGTAYLTSFAGTLACTYRVDGNRILLHGPHGTQVLTRNGKRLEGGMGLTYIQQ